jgi:TetR/AcrR family transcriptional regulator
VARPIAADHGEKRAAIRRTAAQLFAEQGYDRAAMADVARAHGVSKALFYHYYRAKDDLLFDIVGSHLRELVAAAEAALQRQGAPRERLAATISAILACYRDADAEHKVQINHLGRLDAARQAELRALERRLVDIVSGLVVAMNPDLERRLVRPLTMSLFGMLNWKFMWFREDGPVSGAEFAELVTTLYAAGVAALGAKRPEAERGLRPRIRTL